jgi:hypothetical protein
LIARVGSKKRSSGFWVKENKTWTLFGANAHQDGAGGKRRGTKSSAPMHLKHQIEKIIIKSCTKKEEKSFKIKLSGKKRKKTHKRTNYCTMTVSTRLERMEYGSWRCFTTTPRWPGSMKAANDVAGGTTAAACGPE